MEMNLNNCSTCDKCKLDINFDTEVVTRTCTITNNQVEMSNYCKAYSHKNVDAQSNKAVVNFAYEGMVFNARKGI